jgi:hypothetical protein
MILKQRASPATNDKGGYAGYFDAMVLMSDATVNGTLTVTNISLAGNMTVASAGDVVLADCAECFEVCGPDAIEPGTVMAIDEQGALRPSGRGYDKRVAGVVSGAGNYRTAIVLGESERAGNRAVVALVGKTYCKVDAGLAPIEAGDLLTSSDTPGHAMKATDPNRAFGAVIGKALKPLLLAIVRNVAHTWVQKRGNNSSMIPFEETIHVASSDEPQPDLFNEHRKRASHVRSAKNTLNGAINTPKCKLILA